MSDASGSKSTKSCRNLLPVHPAAEVQPKAQRVWRIWRDLGRFRGFGNRHMYLANDFLIVPNPSGGSPDGYKIFRLEYVAEATTLDQVKLKAR
jgi:hypothetical protein